MTVQRLVKALLFPPAVLLALLTPAAIAFLTLAMLFWDGDSALAILSYLLAAYTLTAWCVRMPRMIKCFRKFKRENRYARRWFTDERLRVNTSLWIALVWNAAYGVLQAALGLYHGSFWFFSLALYYLALAAIRLFLARHVRQNRVGEDRRRALCQYRLCGWVLLTLNLALAVIVFFMVYWNRTFHHHEITTIAMAAYTFASFAFATVGIVRYRKYNSPIYSASKAISLAAASVSMLTLASTMLTTFGNAASDASFKKILLAALGGAVSAVIILLAVYMVVQGTKQLKLLQKEEKICGTESES